MPWSFIRMSFSIVASIMVSLPVVAFSPDVVVEGDDLFSQLRAHVLQLVLKKRLDAFVVVRLELERPGTCLLHPFGAMELREPDNAKAASEAVLRVRPVLHDRLHEELCLRPDLLPHRLFRSRVHS